MNRPKSSQALTNSCIEGIGMGVGVIPSISTTNQTFLKTCQKNLSGAMRHDALHIAQIKGTQSKPKEADLHGICVQQQLRLTEGPVTRSRFASVAKTTSIKAPSYPSPLAFGFGVRLLAHPGKTAPWLKIEE